ncbi:MAG: TRZ/ATZ family hydrolase [Pseudohongiella sp.]|nr:TRZ/ATZ family hydrolase [Pseudohongiella sp.]
MTHSGPVHADLLIHASWIVTGTEDQVVHENACLAVSDGKILEILHSASVAARYKAPVELNLQGHALMPGLVNTHGHAAMALFRGIADDLSLHTWLEQYIWPLEGKWVSEEFVYQGTQLAIAEMICSGTTSFADMYFFPDASARAATEAGIRVQLASPIIDFPNPWSSSAEEAIQKTSVLHDEWRHSTLVTTAFGPHAPYSLSDEPIRKIVMLSELLDIPVHMHIHETSFEVEDALSKHGQRPLARLAELGLLSPRLVCVHATQLTDDEIELLNTTGVNIAHCPESNLKLASGFCPVDKLIRAGVNVSLGTDGAASNNDLDMFSEMRTAALLAKAVSGDARALPAYKALQMATINGARALGLDQFTGTLESGKQADVIAVKLNDLNSVPVHNPVSQLVYSTKSSQVKHVWVNGRHLLDDGEFTTLNKQKLLDMAQHWQKTLETLI